MSKTQQRFRPILRYLACGALVLLANQACGGGFVPAINAGAFSSSQSNGSAIRFESAKALTGTSLKFSLPVDAFSPAARFGWTHTLVNPATGAFLNPCLEVSGNGLPTYVLICDGDGELEIDAQVTDGPATLEPFQLKIPVAAISTPNTPGATPDPNPSPGPMPTAPTGAQLYEAKCASCHGTLASSSVQQKSVTGINQALAQISAMQGLNLSAGQIQSISDALNGK
jgi:hypothetical protein